MPVVCGKCESNNVYDDYIPGVGPAGLTCRMCGNTAGSKYGFIDTTQGKGIVEETIKRDLDSGAIVLGSRPDIGAEWRGKDMGVKKVCRNCKREKQNCGDGCCSTCYRAAKGLEGEKKEVALAAIKAKIDSGEVKPRGGSPSRVVVPKTPARPAGKHRETKKAIGQRISGAPEPHTLSPNRSEPGDKLDSHPQCPLWPLPGGDFPNNLAQYKETEEILARMTAMASLFPPQSADDEIDSVTIHFTAADSALSEGLLSLARKWRRTPDQQLLWLLERELNELPSRDGLKLRIFAARVNDTSAASI